ncbi:hypothetical protein DL98DRAFT_565863 [Cadophora sp. DSE1049]|nr:hypothetical protein DL98DRAFT_565863 [Cadophora sp. DSE1049]
MSSSDIAALEEEQQRLLKAIQDSNKNAAAITTEYRSAIAQKHAAFSDTSRRYSRWVDRQARKMTARLDKKRKQLQRNKKMMGFRKDVLLAETEGLNSKIAQTETDRAIKIAHVTSRLEEIERDMANKLNTGTRKVRSRAPSPEQRSTSAYTVNLNRAVPVSLPDEVKNNTSCGAEVPTASRQRCSKFLPTSTSKSANKAVSKLPYGKIIWKVKYNTDSPLPSFSSSAVPPPNPGPTDEKKKKNDKNDKSTKKSNPSINYIWKEYDHAEIFEEPDNPDDEDYEPEIED